MDQELRRSPWQRLGMGPEGENASRQAKGMLLWLPRCGAGSLLLSRQLVKECRWSIQSFRSTDSSQTQASSQTVRLGSFQVCLEM